MPAPTLIVGAPCWIDLYSSDTARATEFYGRLFGWKAEAPQVELEGYFTFSKDGKYVGGCMANDGEAGYPDAWGVHLMTDDVDAIARAVPEHGGTVEFEPMTVGDNGRSTMVRDPGGAIVGAWQPGTQKGFDVTGEPGTAAWFELHTHDYDASVAFYRDVFGWETHAVSDTDEFRYTTLGEGESQLAGIMDDSVLTGDEVVPAHWAVYFAVTDADATIAHALELGGTVVRPAEDTPYGRLAQLADPTGTVFRIVQDNT